MFPFAMLRRVHTRSTYRSLLLVVPWCCQCATSSLDTGRLYLARSQTGLAWEYLAAGVAQDPSDQALHDAAIVAQETQVHERTQIIQDLTEAHLPRPALASLVVLEDAAAAGKPLQLTP